MRTTAATLLAAALAALALSASAGARTMSNWYWTPGVCKSQLHNYGVQIGDGRTFNVEQAYCVGYHNHCWMQNGLRRYKVFLAVMRSYDGVVRTMQLTVTGKSSWSGGKLKITESYMPVEDFNYAYGTAAWSVASNENRAGCWDIHP